MTDERNENLQTRRTRKWKFVDELGSIYRQTENRTLMGVFRKTLFWVRPRLDQRRVEHKKQSF